MALSEYQIHCQIADYLNMVIKSPSRWTSHEVSNQQSGLGPMIRQKMLKRKGVTTGWPDIEIHWKIEGERNCVWKHHIRIIFLEVKDEKGTLSKSQINLHKELRAEGDFVAVVRSVEDVKKFLEELGII